MDKTIEPSALWLVGLSREASAIGTVHATGFFRDVELVSYKNPIQGSRIKFARRVF